ncbi:MULE domain-containing protein [Aphis craccivora]|uniref:MULE domain-containing protein n=1 Tax=Aphis craccivora TaxID=307492 RepID=A0A6G0X7E6_APHCR|nr:MULE domain-containing protein [Aphis craccivora]
MFLDFERFTVFNKTIRTNNYVESFHAALLKFIKPHPKIWEFIGIVKWKFMTYIFICKSKCLIIDQIRFIENLYVIEFHQVLHNKKVCKQIKRTGHRVDGYITQEIGPYPDEHELL